jgi:hypothetical protein
MSDDCMPTRLSPTPRAGRMAACGARLAAGRAGRG